MSTGPVIVIVEDDPAVLSTVQKALRSTAAVVHLFANPREAVQFSTGARRVDLLVADVVMPGLHGFEVAELIRKSHPSLRMIFTSGYPSDAWLPAEYPAGAVFLPKPFSPTELTAAVAEQLAQRGF